VQQLEHSQQERFLRADEIGAAVVAEQNVLEAQEIPRSRPVVDGRVFDAQPPAFGGAPTAMHSEDELDERDPDQLVDRDARRCLGFQPHSRLLAPAIVVAQELQPRSSLSAPEAAVEQAVSKQCY
jgi:hypothetical protein